MPVANAAERVVNSNNITLPREIAEVNVENL